VAYDAGAPLSNGQAVASRTRIVLRPLGSPLPLGLLALAPAAIVGFVLAGTAVYTSRACASNSSHGKGAS